jgi:hypothetical protein
VLKQVQHDFFILFWVGQLKREVKQGDTFIWAVAHPIFLLFQFQRFERFFEGLNIKNGVGIAGRVHQVVQHLVDPVHRSLKLIKIGHFIFPCYVFVRILFALVQVVFPQKQTLLTI